MRRHALEIGVEDTAAGGCSGGMDAMTGTRRGGKPVDLTAAEIDMGIGIGIIADADGHAVAAEVPAGGCGQGVCAMGCPVVIVERLWRHRLRCEVADKGKCADLLQNGKGGYCG